MVTSIAGGREDSVGAVRRTWAVGVVVTLAMGLPWVVVTASAAPAVVDTTVPTDDTFVFTPEDDPENPDGQLVGEPAESTTTTTSTTLPSAVTTLPPGCPPAPVALAVFTGEAVTRDDTSVTFRVDQVRAGSLDVYLREGTVTVRYGGDARHLEIGRSYIVGVTAADPAAQLLQSTIRDDAIVIGEPEGLSVGPVCPEFEEVARTLNDDGTAVRASAVAMFFSQGWRVVAAVVLPALMVLALLLGAVFVRRGLAR